MTASDKNRKTKRANKMLAVTKAVEIKWAAKAETRAASRTESGAESDSDSDCGSKAPSMPLSCLSFSPLMFSENLHIMIRADGKLGQRARETSADDIGTWQRPSRDQQRLPLGAAVYKFYEIFKSLPCPLCPPHHCKRF